MAENGSEFINRVRSVTGLDLEILSQEIEAQLAVAGCATLLDMWCDLALVFDIGGGSSELIWLDLSGQAGQQPFKNCRSPLRDARVLAWTSLPVGVVTLAERFDGRDVTEASFEAMVADALAWPPSSDDGLRIAVGTSDASSRRMSVAITDALEGHPGVADVVQYRIGPSVGAHTGPGTSGLFVF